MCKNEGTKKIICKVWKKIEIFAIIIGLLCSIFSVFVAVNSWDKTLADIGFTKYQLKVAEEYKMHHDYSNSLALYEKVIEKDGTNSYYAAYNMGYIYSELISNKDYLEAWKYYRYASFADDINILKGCLCFILNQNELFHNNPDAQNINVFDNSEFECNNNGININNLESNKRSNNKVIIDLLNKINKLDPNFLEQLNINLPLTETEQMEEIFEKKYNSISYRWKYVSTRTSYNGSEAFVNENEKLVLVDSWQESTDETSFSTVTVYKYYRYKLTEENIESITFSDYLKDYCANRNEPEIIY